MIAKLFDTVNECDRWTDGRTELPHQCVAR